MNYSTRKHAIRLVREASSFIANDDDSNAISILKAVQDIVHQNPKVVWTQKFLDDVAYKLDAAEAREYDDRRS